MYAVRLRLSLHTQLWALAATDHALESSFVLVLHQVENVKMILLPIAVALLAQVADTTAHFRRRRVTPGGLQFCLGLCKYLLRVRTTRRNDDRPRPAGPRRQSHCFMGLIAGLGARPLPRCVELLVE